MNVCLQLYKDHILHPMEAGCLLENDAFKEFIRAGDAVWVGRPRVNGCGPRLVKQLTCDDRHLGAPQRNARMRVRLFLELIISPNAEVRPPVA
jgi:hypothetical protein